MPIYEFRCDACDSEFEQILPIGHRGGKRCPACGRRARRLISRSSFQLKGSGWYKDLYSSAKPSGGDKGGGGRTKESKSAAGG
jgi:putative FmdB family regulatory protein